MRSGVAERNQRYDALFLRTRDSPSGDRIASFLTAEAGIVDTFVFGGAKSSMRSSASPFVHAQVNVYHDPVKHFRKLNDLDIVEAFLGIRDSYDKLMAAGTIAEIIIRTSGCGGEFARVTDLTLRSLRCIDSCDESRAELILLSYLWKILELMGLRPDPESCIHCGKPLDEGPARGGIAYSPEQDGFVCSRCAGDLAPLGAGVRAILLRMSVEEIEACAALEVKPEELESLRKVLHYLAQSASEGTLLTLAGR